MKVQHVELTGAELKTLCDPILKALNELKDAGHDHEKVLLALMYTLGGTMAHIGLSEMMFSIPVKQAFLPMWMGFEATRNSMILEMHQTEKPEA